MVLRMTSGRPHLGAAQDSGQRDVVPLDSAFSHCWYRGPAGHVEGARQPVKLAALQHRKRDNIKVEFFI